MRLLSPRSPVHGGGSLLFRKDGRCGAAVGAHLLHLTLLRVRNALKPLLARAVFQRLAESVSGWMVVASSGHPYGAHHPASRLLISSHASPGSGLESMVCSRANLLQQLLAHHPRANAARNRVSHCPCRCTNRLPVLTGTIHRWCCAVDLVGALVDRFAADLNRLAVGEGFDTAQSAEALRRSWRLIRCERARSWVGGAGVTRSGVGQDPVLLRAPECLGLGAITAS